MFGTGFDRISLTVMSGKKKWLSDLHAAEAALRQKVDPFRNNPTLKSPWTLI